MARRSIEIANEIEKDILGGLLVDGELINENAIAERFAVSRTPVREALLSLSSTGLVRLERGRGAVVVGVSLQQVFDAYEVLATLSGLAAELTAARMTALQRARLFTLHEEMRSHQGNGQREEYVALDDQFHALIVEGSGNTVLAQQIAHCSRVIAAVRHASMESHASLDSMHGEHDEVVAAIARRDGEAARRAMAGHLQLRGDSATRLVAAWRKHQPKIESVA